MTSARPGSDEVRTLRALAAEWGKVEARRAFEPQAPGRDVNLHVLEELALEISRGLEPARHPGPDLGPP